MKKLSKALGAIIGMTLVTSSYAINYTYDALDRLVSVNYDKQFINYTYDDGGNLIDVETNIFLYTINGRLLDKQKNPIVGAMVQVDKRAFAITDSNGYWEIIDLPEGHYNLAAKKEGFAFMEQDFEVGNQHWITELKIPVLSEFKARIIPANLKKPAEQGKNFRFNITAINGGDQIATNASIVYTIPENTQLVSIQGLGDVECDGVVNDDNETTCILPKLPIGAMIDIEVELYLELNELLGPKPSLKNVATLYSNYPNTDVATRYTAIQPYLSVFCEGIPNPIVLGGLLHYECDIELNDNAPKEVATGVHFKMQLPDELRPEFVSTTSEGHICDTSNWPTLNCPIGELSVANPNDISEVTVVVESVLEDIIMLELTSLLQVTADNCEGHINEVTTQIDFGDVEIDAVIALDVTNSMKPILNSIIKVVETLLKETFATEGDAPFIAIVSFRDRNEIKLEAATDELEHLLNALEGLEASRGGECPEASAQASLIAVKHIKPKGSFIFFTDSLPYEDAETQAALDEIAQVIGSKDIHVFAPITVDENCIDNYK
ncbi:MAG: hypothetical protein DRQ49_13530 [Gammaproteobacteria bacterium]|nr:MAG: hypothetical protein DRQ49_13530 [Gammaproteobacteria bacterium]RKZ73656.1 MAG: hypothetical protein DRQ57_13670 [Gammaproteobacteria bacterium]